MSLALVTNKSYAPCEDAVDGDDCENQSERYNCTFQPLALPGSSVPVPLITLTDFGHKEGLLRLETVETFDQSDVQTKRQKTKYSLIISGQFRTLAMFFFVMLVLISVWLIINT